MYLLQVVGLRPQMFPLYSDLLFDGPNLRRYQAQQAEPLPLFVRKRRALVVEGVPQELRAAAGRFPLEAISGWTLFLTFQSRPGQVPGTAMGTVATRSNLRSGGSLVTASQLLVQFHREWNHTLWPW